MALKEQNIIFTTVDADGNTVIYLPITSIENVEGAIKDVSLDGQKLIVTFVDGTKKEFTTQGKEYSVMTGASASANGAEGLVPAPSAGSQTTKFLRADGTWQVPPDTNTEYGAMKGASASANGAEGLVPAPSAGDQAKVLSGAGAYVDLDDISGTVAIANGGTGATDAVTACTNLGIYNSDRHLVLPSGAELW